MKEEDLEKLSVILDCWIDGNLSEVQREELETIVAENKEAKKVFVDFLHQHASLYRQVSENWDPQLDCVEPDAKIESTVVMNEGRISWLSIAAIVCVAIAMYLFYAEDSKTNPSKSYAEIIEVANAQWGNSDFPTRQGTKLGKGHLQLHSGTAQIRFDSGVLVSIEAPAEFEIIDAMHCRLQMGFVVVDVPEQAKGFKLDTESTSLIDHGTRFSVAKHKTQNLLQVNVIEGHVEAQHKVSQDEAHLKTGQTLLIKDTGFSIRGEFDIEPKRMSVTEELIELNEKSTRLTTSDGRGKEWTIVGGEMKIHRSDINLLIKNTGNKYKGVGFLRKIYLGFDLAAIGELNLSKVSGVKLHLKEQPSGFGVSSSLPAEIKFHVYGLKDESQDAWPAESLKWAEAPGNVDDAGAMNEAMCEYLAEFSVPKGLYNTEVAVDDPRLLEFIKNDTNQIVTLILVRKTTDKEGTLVHAFAGRNHPTEPGPALEFIYK